MQKISLKPWFDKGGFFQNPHFLSFHLNTIGRASKNDLIAFILDPPITRSISRALNILASEQVMVDPQVECLEQ